MATALPYNPNLECSICLESYTNPKILSCGHSFCRECLEGYIDSRRRTFPCPVCQQDVEIPRGGVKSFITNYSLKTLTDSPKTTAIPITQPSTSLKPKHHCPNHIKKEVDYYCQTCNFGLCSKCIYKDHKDHNTLDLECDSTRKKVFQELLKSEQFLKNKIKDLEKSYASLLETSENLKSFCDEACIKIRKNTTKIIGELKRNCEKSQQEIRDHFVKNESQLTETRQKVMNQIQTIKTDLDTSHPTTEEPSLTLIYSLNKLQDLQKLCENMKTDIPTVTYVEWRDGSVKVCDILGSTVTKPLNQSSKGSRLISTATKPLYQSVKGSGPTSTVTKPLYQSSEGSGLISTVTKRLYQSVKGSGLISTVNKPLYQSREDNVVKFNYKDIKRDDEYYYSKDKCTAQGMVWSSRASRSSYTGRLYIDIKLLPEDNPRVKYCEIKYIVTLLNEYKNKNVISETRTKRFTPGEIYSGSEIEIPWNKLTYLSEGFIDNEGQFLVRLDILQVLETRYKWWFQS